MDMGIQPQWLNIPGNNLLPHFLNFLETGLEVFCYIDSLYFSPNQRFFEKCADFGVG